MVMRPEPYFLSCEKCGWERYFAPRSDALTALEAYPESAGCPRCAYPVLQRKSANNLKGVLHGLFGRRGPRF